MSRLVLSDTLSGRVAATLDKASGGRDVSIREPDPRTSETAGAHGPRPQRLPGGRARAGPPRVAPSNTTRVLLKGARR
jgi:hypothetical protein